MATVAAVDLAGDGGGIDSDGGGVLRDSDGDSVLLIALVLDFIPHNFATHGKSYSMWELLQEVLGLRT